MAKKSFTKIKGRIEPEKTRKPENPKKDHAKGRKATLNFTIDADIKLRFRRLAMDSGMKLNAFLVELMDRFEEKPKNP